MGTKTGHHPQQIGHHHFGHHLVCRGGSRGGPRFGHHHFVWGTTISGRRSPVCPPCVWGAPRVSAWPPVCVGGHPRVCLLLHWWQLCIREHSSPPAFCTNGGGQNTRARTRSWSHTTQKQNDRIGSLIGLHIGREAWRCDATHTTPPHPLPPLHPRLQCCRSLGRQVSTQFRCRCPHRPRGFPPRGHGVHTFPGRGLMRTPSATLKLGVARGAE